MRIRFFTKHPFTFSNGSNFNKKECAVTILSGIAGLGVLSVFTFYIASYCIRKYKVSHFSQFESSTSEGKTASVGGMLHSKDKTNWRDKFVNSAQFRIADWQNQYINEIVKALENDKHSVESSYEEIYVVFPYPQGPDKVFSSDGVWCNARDRILGLSEKEKESVLVLFVPEEKISSQRLNQDDYFDALLSMQAELAGVTIKTLTDKDFQSIRNGKVPKNLIKALEK